VVDIHDVAADASGRERKSHGILDAIDAVAFVREKIADENFPRDDPRSSSTLEPPNLRPHEFDRRSRRFERDPELVKGSGTSDCVANL
jgi:hypothetical protein